MPAVEALGAGVVIEDGKVNFGRPLRTRFLDSPGHQFLRYSSSVPWPKNVDLLQLHRPWLGSRGGYHYGREFDIANWLVTEDGDLPANGRIGEIPLQLAACPVSLLHK